MKSTFFLMLAICFMLAAGEAGTEKKPVVAAKPVPQPEPSLTAYTDTLNKLNKQDSAILEQAVMLYDALSPHDSTGADSAASALMRFVKEVVKKENDSLYRNNEDFAPLLNPANTTLTNRQKAVMSGLHANRLKLVSNGEGGVYVVPSYETILPTLKARTSVAVDQYLDLVAREDTSPVFRDAGLAIELTELVDRLITSENLLDYPLPKRFNIEAGRLNLFYTEALVNGADNSPSLDFGTTNLDDNFRKTYDYLLAKYPASEAAAKINVWLAVIASGDKKKITAFRRTMN